MSRVTTSPPSPDAVEFAAFVPEAPTCTEFGTATLCNSERMQAKSATPPWWLYACVLLATVAVDLATKALAHQGPYDGFPIEPVRNDELALGVASFDIGLLPLLALAAVSGFVLVYGFKLSRQSRSAAVFYCLLLGGVLGNAIDRLVTGSVHDWLDMGVAIANIADFFIVAGLAWFVVAAWRSVA